MSLSVDGNDKIENVKVFCCGLIYKHFTILNRLQDSNLADYEEAAQHKKFNFIETTNSSVDTHVHLSKNFVDRLAESELYTTLTKAYFLWTTQLRHVALRFKVKSLRVVYSDIPKLLAALMLIHGKYAQASACLSDCIALNEDDTGCRLMLILWLCQRGDWKLAKAALDHEAMMRASPSSSYNQAIDALKLTTYFNLSHHKGPIVKNLIALWKSIKTSNAKTFMQYQCQSIILRALILASRLPNVNMLEIDDPLKNSDIEVTRLQVLVKNRFAVFFADEKPPNLQVTDTEVDELLKISSNISEYMDAVKEYSNQLLDAGLIRDCETYGFYLWKLSWRMAILPRIVSVVNVLLLCESMYISGRHNFLNLLCVLATMLKSIPPEDVASSKKECESKSPKKRNSDLLKESIRNVDFAHRSNCCCVVCQIQKFSAHFNIEVAFSSCLLERFGLSSFRRLAERFAAVQEQVDNDFETIRSSMSVDVREKIKYPPMMRQLFLTASVRCLRSETEMDDQTRTQIIENCAKLMADEPWIYRSCWLMLRQILRGSLPPPNVSWVKIPVVDTVYRRMPFKNLSQNITSQFDDIHLASHENKSTLKRRQRRVKSVKTSEMADCQENDKESFRWLIEEAENDFKCYSHLFLSEWRYAICSYLAWASADCSGRNPNWVSAFYFSESTCCATRQGSRMGLESFFDFRFCGVDDFVRAVQRLPADMTVVQLAFDINHVLWLIRLHSERLPCVVPLCYVPKDDDFLKMIQQLLSDNENSCSSAHTFGSAQEFWNLRRALDSRVKLLMDSIEENWFRTFVLLLLPCNTSTDSSLNCMLENVLETGCPKSFAEILYEFLPLVEEQIWFKLAERFAALTCESFKPEVLFRIFEGSRDETVSGDIKNVIGFAFLHLPPELSSFPIEVLPSSLPHYHICRIASFYYFQLLLHSSSKIPKKVDGKKCYYVLDPDGNLKETQRRMTRILQQHPWKGTVGYVPDQDELVAILSSSDFFFYLGHGSGMNYFGRTTIRRSNCNAVVVLMGCSSLRITYEGDGLDGRGVMYDYTIAKCPCVIGCLWMVTDGEIDRFFVAFLNACFSSEKASNLFSCCSPEESCRLIVDALAHARRCVKLRYLTGNAVVSFGIPVMTYCEDIAQ